MQFSLSLHLTAWLGEDRNKRKISRKEMANMALSKQLLNVTRQRDTFAPDGHAMPFGLGYLCFNGGIAISPKFRIRTNVFAQGTSVPISRGDPPAPA
jgi:hypothetical protein